MNRYKQILMSTILLFSISSTLAGADAGVIAALNALYNTTNGPNWTHNNGWHGDKDPCGEGKIPKWYGVTCNLSKNVIGLDLSNNNLVGTIPSNIQFITDLRTLKLNNNELKDEITPTITTLSLNTLFLNNNLNLSATDDVRDYINGLSNNNGGYTNIVYTNVTKFEERVLIAFYNSTNGDSWTNNSDWFNGNIPCHYGNTWHGISCYNLRVTRINLNHNQLSGTIPTQIENLTNLQELFLSSNQLSGSIPTQIGNLTNLQKLSLSSNQLSGSIPIQIENLTNLQKLSLSENQLTGSIPAEIGNLTSLVGLHLDHNQLSGSIPTEIGNLTGLTGFTGAHDGLSLNNNNLSGTIPSSITNLINLDSGDGLDLADNKALYADSATQTFINDKASTKGGYSYILSSNDNAAQRAALVNIYNTTNGGSWTTKTNWLNGDPCEWYGVTCIDGNVTALDLHNNNLEGEITSSIGDLSFLTALDLHDNGLYGTIPSTMTSLGSLTSLALGDNQALYADSATQTFIDGLEGAGTYAALESSNAIASQRAVLIDLYNATDGANWSTNTNWLSNGPCTNNWSGITCTNGNIIFINLNNKNLNGTIPASIEDLTSLTSLTLSVNQLSGTIPTSIGDLTSLTSLNLSENQLSGTIPASISNLNSLTNLNIHVNKALYADALTRTYIDTFGAGKYQQVLDTNKNAAQRTALIDFYNATNGDDWTTKTNWLNLEDHCDWHGVTCVDYEVTAFDLHGNNLIGNISSSINDLTQLTSLDLHDNKLSGYITTNIALLGSLTSLALGDNQALYADSATQTFIDAVEGAGTYAGIEASNAIASQRAALIDLYNATGGENWTISTNWLEGNPCEWSNLTCTDGNVTALNFGWNNLNGTIPTSISDLTSLTSLSLAANQFSGEIPAALFNLTSLTTLSLRNNQFSGTIPSAIGNLTNLTNLYLNENQLSGTIPASISNLNSLTTLQLGSNKALYADSATKAFIIEKTNSSGYNSILYSNANAAQRDALIELYNYAEGEYWTNSTNWLNSENHCDWYGVTCVDYQVTALDLHSNNLDGRITSSIGDLSFLTTLDLHDNGLYGYIPSTISSLGSLTSLALGDNQALYADSATQTFIDSVEGAGTYAAIESSNAITSQRDALVDLYNATDGDNWTTSINWLDGYPCSWSGVTCRDSKIIGLELSSNQLSGTIPTEVGDLANLTMLSLDNNQLSGSIPTELFNLVSLQEVDLSSNVLSGSIPADFNLLADLTKLSLNSNQFDDSIPAELGDLINLVTLSLDNNQLSGAIPTEIGGLTNLELLSLEENQLDGEISNSITQLNNLISPNLYLNANNCIYSDNEVVQTFIADKTGDTYENFLASQISCEAQEEDTLNITPVIMYLLN